MELIEFALSRSDDVTRAAQFLDEQLNHDLFFACQRLISDFQITENCNLHPEILYYPQGRFEQQKIAFVPKVWLPSTKNSVAENWFKHFFAYAYFELDLFDTQSEVYQFQSKYFFDHSQNFFCIRFRLGWHEFIKDQKFNYLKSERMKVEFKEQEKILIHETNNLRFEGFELDTIRNCWYIKIAAIDKDLILMAYRNGNVMGYLQPVLDALFKIQAEFETFKFSHDYMKRCVEFFKEEPF